MDETGIWKEEHIWHILLETVSWIISIRFLVEKNDYDGRLFLKFVVGFYSKFTYLALDWEDEKSMRKTIHISSIPNTLNI